MRKQITFYGKECVEKALTRLKHLNVCFKIKKAEIEYYEKGEWDFWDNHLRCRLVVRYE